MRFLRQSLTGLFLVALTLGVLVFAGQLVRDAVQERMDRAAHVPTIREREFAVNVVVANPQTIVPVLSAFGQIQSRRTLDVRAATGGTVVELAAGFVEGGQVQAGAVLARIDPANAQSALARAQSDLQDAISEVRDAVTAVALARDETDAAREQVALRERAFQRQSDLKSRGVGTEAAVEVAELAAASARAAVLARRQSVAKAEARVDQSTTRKIRAEIALAEAERRLVDTVITARFGGTLSEVNVVEGGLVTPNERLARLVDPSALEVAFRISTVSYARILDDAGQLLPAVARVALDVGAVDLATTGRISRDSAAVGEGQTGRLIFASLDAARGLKPGDFVTVEIDEPPLSDVVRLPSSALDASARILVLGDDARLEVMQVELVRRQGDDVLVRGVKGGAALDGREVVAERSPLLGAGIKVRRLDTQSGIPHAVEMLELSEERRARLVAFVEGNQRMPEEARSRILAQLSKEKVLASVVERIEKRMGG
ncbi:MAG: HlyD family efflux transporter periplasmic adaptor subunit [Rhodobacterales bacterium]|nr:HlyD family efflux transporter periplasmic adaptor subunit [Rhodobacterales bacterium]